MKSSVQEEITNFERNIVCNRRLPRGLRFVICIRIAMGRLGFQGNQSRLHKTLPLLSTLHNFTVVYRWLIN